MIIPVLIIGLFAFFGFFLAPFIIVENLFAASSALTPYLFPFLSICLILYNLFLILEVGLKKSVSIMIVIAILILGLYEYYRTRDIINFDVSKISYIDIDTNYEILDREYHDKETIDLFVKQFSAEKVRFIYDEIEDDDKQKDYTIKFCDENGKVLKKIEYFKDDRFKVGNFLCIPTDLKNNAFASTLVFNLVERKPKLEIKEELQDEIARIAKEAKYENGNLIIEIPDMKKYDSCYLTSIRVKTVDENGKKDKQIYLYNETYNENLKAGDYITVPLDEKIEGKKVSASYIELYVFNMGIVFNVDELIPADFLVK